MNINPLTKADFPDPDVIRVDNTYYMITTTMHFMPGGAILQSYDLIHWELASYLYETLEDTPTHQLALHQNIYGQGMWAGCLRHHNNKFYAVFSANDTKKTYLFTSSSILGPWNKEVMEGFYYDPSLLFDQDRVFIVHGNRQIFITELTPSLLHPLKNGLHRSIVIDASVDGLGYEGSHIYKISGKYYVFFIHWTNTGNKRRTQACFMSDSLVEEFTGGDILDDDMNYHNQGIAQGGIVNTPDGTWYSILFQDHGAVGRIPVLVPVSFTGGLPVFGIQGKVPTNPKVAIEAPPYQYTPLITNDSFSYKKEHQNQVKLHAAWQWNHNPDSCLWQIDESRQALQIQTGKLAENVTQAVNCLTQRMVFPGCEAIVTVDGSQLNDGDYIGLCALQGCFGQIALAKDEGNYFLSMSGRFKIDNRSTMGRVNDFDPSTECARIPIQTSQLRLRLVADFNNQIDKVTFYYEEDDQWKPLGIPHPLHFLLDHFVGCRVGLFVYSTVTTGGIGRFQDFRIRRIG